MESKPSNLCKNTLLCSRVWALMAKPKAFVEHWSAASMTLNKEKKYKCCWIIYVLDLWTIWGGLLKWQNLAIFVWCNAGKRKEKARKPVKKNQGSDHSHLDLKIIMCGFLLTLFCSMLEIIFAPNIRLYMCVCVYKKIIKDTQRYMTRLQWRKWYGQQRAWTWSIVANFLHGRKGEFRCLRRSDLIEAMAEALPAGTIHFGFRIVEVQMDTHSHPILHLDDGSTITSKVMTNAINYPSFFFRSFIFWINH